MKSSSTGWPLFVESLAVGLSIGDAELTLGRVRPCRIGSGHAASGCFIFCWIRSGEYVRPSCNRWAIANSSFPCKTGHKTRE